MFVVLVIVFVKRHLKYGAGKKKYTARTKMEEKGATFFIHVYTQL